MGNEPSSTSVLLHLLVDQQGVLVTMKPLWKLGDWMELPRFQKLEYLMRTKEHKTTQNTRVEATETRREMVG